MRYDDTRDYTNVELAILWRGAKDFQPFARYLAARTKYPWYFGTHFDHGHTMPCDQLQEIDSRLSFMVIAESAAFLPKVTMPSFNGRATRLLYMTPIYDSEPHYAENNSTRELLKMLENHHDPLDIKRERVV